MVGRRTFVSTLATGTAVASVLRATPATPASLKERASKQGFAFGSAATRAHLSRDASYARLVAEEATLLVPEVELKWETLRPTPERFNFDPGDWMLSFAKEHAMVLRGHTLVWHEALPAWFGNIVNRKNAKQLLVEHISTVVKHCADQVHSWDVVNEIIEPADRRPDGLRGSPWLQLLGPEYIDLAFHTAQQADPKALLVWNENWLESDAAFCVAKRAHVLRWLKGCRARGVPIQALGLQAHLHADLPLAADFGDFLERVSDLGVKLLVTELDVVDYKLPAERPVRDQLVAERYYEFLSTFLRNKAAVAVITWGLSDRYSWLNKIDKYRRSDQLPLRPLPYDADLRPKSAWDAIAKAFDLKKPETAWLRTQSVTEP